MVPFIPDASVPEGLRLYVIGDVHGMLDRLVSAHHWIEADLDARPVPDWRIIHIGDYIDRGPDSAGVLAFLAERDQDSRVLSLMGNHDEYLLRFVDHPTEEHWADWLRFGGETFHSFGIEAVSLTSHPTGTARRALAADLASRVSTEIRMFLENLPYQLTLGDYHFVHAGIRPGVPLEAQTRQDLTWIREPFLSSIEDHGAVVVHGHTPTDEIDLQRNRIGIDTGAVFGGPLTCLVLEGTEIAQLTATGLTLLL